MDSYVNDEPRTKVIVIHAVIVFLCMVCIGAILCGYMPSVAYMFAFISYTYMGIIFGVILYALMDRMGHRKNSQEVNE